MGRIRTIKPGFWKHEVLSELPEPTHMLAAALLNYADDEGYFNAHPGLVKAECMPLREPSVTIPVMLQELSAAEFIQLGTGADGKRYGRIIKFCEHQVISHAKPSKIKCVEISWDDSGTVPGNIQDRSLPEEEGEEEGKRKEQEGGDANAPPARSASHVKQSPVKPKPSRGERLPSDFEVPEGWIQSADEARERHGLPALDLKLEAEKFVNYWAAKTGQQATKLDWRKTFVNWCLKAEAPRGNGRAPPQTKTGLSPYSERHALNPLQDDEPERSLPEA